MTTESGEYIYATENNNGITRRDALAGEYGPMIMLADKIEYLFSKDKATNSPEALISVEKFKVARQQDVAKRAYILADQTIAESKK